MGHVDGSRSVVCDVGRLSCVVALMGLKNFLKRLLRGAARGGIDATTDALDEKAAKTGGVKGVGIAIFDQMAHDAADKAKKKIGG